MMSRASVARASTVAAAADPATSADDAYTSELLGYSLERLAKEPELLRADGDRLRRQVQELAVSQYGAFIAAAECTSAVAKEVADIREHVRSLHQSLPTLAGSCNSFAQAAERISASRAHNRHLLQHHGRVPPASELPAVKTRADLPPASDRTLVDLLEVGSLLDTCVRTGAFDEALDLDALCAKLAAAAPGVPVAARLASEAGLGVRSLLAQLLHRLRGPVQLPECLRLVGYLRRLGVFSEHQLRLTFLRCRDAWLATCIADLDTPAPAARSSSNGDLAAGPGGGSYEHAKRLTDVHRTHLFDCVMQFRAVFADTDTPAAPASGAWRDGTYVGELPVSGTALVHAWATYRVAAFLDLLSSAVAGLTEAAALAGVMEQCAYCGASLGRVGLDFRPLLGPLFRASAQRVVVTSLNNALDTFDRSLAHHRWTAPQPLPAAAGGARDGDGGPPASLLAHPPVAVLLNGLLAALNELRHVPMPTLRQPLAGALHEALHRAAGALVRCHRGLDPGDAAAVACRGMAGALADTAAPYAATCFGRIFPGGADEVDAKRAVEAAHELAAHTGGAGA